EGPVNDARVGPVAARDRLETEDRRPAITLGEQAQSPRNPKTITGRHGGIVRDPADGDRRAGFGPVVGLHRRELRWLSLGDHPGDQVAAGDLEGDADRGDGKRDPESPAVEGVGSIPQEEEGVDGGDREASW